MNTYVLIFARCNADGDGKYDDAYVVRFDSRIDADLFCAGYSDEALASAMSWGGYPGWAKVIGDGDLDGEISDGSTLAEDQIEYIAEHVMSENEWDAFVARNGSWQEVYQRAYSKKEE